MEKVFHFTPDLAKILVEQTLNQGKKPGVTIMDICKVFDTLNHQLIPTKSDGCDFPNDTLVVTQSYLLEHF